MGNGTSKALGLLQIGPGADVEGERNGVEEDLAKVIQATGKHPKVFDGVGKVKDYKF